MEFLKKFGISGEKTKINPEKINNEEGNGKENADKRSEKAGMTKHMKTMLTRRENDLKAKAKELKLKAIEKELQIVYSPTGAKMTVRASKYLAMACIACLVDPNIFLTSIHLDDMGIDDILNNPHDILHLFSNEGSDHSFGVSDATNGDKGDSNPHLDGNVEDKVDDESEVRVDPPQNRISEASDDSDSEDSNNDDNHSDTDEPNDEEPSSNETESDDGGKTFDDYMKDVKSSGEIKIDFKDTGNKDVGDYLKNVKSYDNFEVYTEDKNVGKGVEDYLKDVKPNSSLKVELPDGDKSSSPDIANLQKEAAEEYGETDDAVYVGDKTDPSKVELGEDNSDNKVEVLGNTEKVETVETGNQGKVEKVELGKGGGETKVENIGNSDTPKTKDIGGESRETAHLGDSQHHKTENLSEGQTATKKVGGKVNRIVNNLSKIKSGITKIGKG